MQYLSKEKANEIVKAANQIIEESINVMDKEGVIIASSNPLRVNTYHEVAKRIVDQKLPFLHVMYDQQYIGTKKGVNYPIMVEGDVIGVVGITGEAKEVEKYGQLITKLTSILLLEDYLKQRKHDVDVLKQNYLTDWVNLTEDITEEFYERGLSLDIDLKIERRLVFIRLIARNQMASLEEINQLYYLRQSITEYLQQKDHDSLFFTYNNMYVLATTNIDDGRILNFLKKLKYSIEKKYLFDVYMGIGHKPYMSSYKMQRKSAIDALQMAFHNIDKRIVFYDEMTIETLVHLLPAPYQQNYIKRVFKNVDDVNLKAYIHTLEIYYQQEGSLKKTAQLLNLHPNTLQYQLKKIKDVTNYDPRSLKDAATFILTISFYRNMF